MNYINNFKIKNKRYPLPFKITKIANNCNLIVNKVRYQINRFFNSNELTQFFIF